MLVNILQRVDWTLRPGKSCYVLRRDMSGFSMDRSGSGRKCAALGQISNQWMRLLPDQRVQFAPLLRSLSNKTGLGDLPAGLRAAAASLGASAHDLHIRIFATLGGTGFADVSANVTKLIFKPRVCCEQSHAHATYRR